MLKNSTVTRQAVFICSVVRMRESTTLAPSLICLIKESAADSGASVRNKLGLFAVETIKPGGLSKCEVNLWSYFINIWFVDYLALKKFYLLFGLIPHPHPTPEKNQGEGQGRSPGDWALNSRLSHNPRPLSFLLQVILCRPHKKIAFSLPIFTLLLFLYDRKLILTRSIWEIKAIREPKSKSKLWKEITVNQTEKK